MRVRWTVLIAASFLLLALKFFVFSRIEIQGAGPDVLLILFVYVALFAPEGEALAVAWLLGLLADFTSCEVFGLFSTLYVLLAILLIRLREEIYVDRVLLPAVFTFVASLQTNMIQAGLLFLRYDADLFAGAFYCALYTLFLTPCMTWAFHKLKVMETCTTQ